MAEKIQIDKLEGAHNWAYWKFQVGILLKSHEVLDIVSGSRTVPVGPGAGASEQDVEKHEKALRVYNKSDSQAMLDISVSMKPDIGQLVSTCKTAKEMWDKLHSIYEQSSGQRRDLLYTQLFTYQKEAGDSVIMHVTKLQRLFNELQVEVVKLGHSLPDDLLIHRIIGTLPMEYFEFKNSWESVPEVDRSIKVLTERLCGLEIRLKQEKGIDSQNTSVAFISENEGNKMNKQHKKSFKKKFDKKNAICYNCNKKGHFKNECRSATKEKPAAKEDKSIPGSTFI